MLVAYFASIHHHLQVARISDFEELKKKFDVDIYSSDLGVWKTSQVSCDENVAWGSCNIDKVVIVNGVLYWIEEKDRLLVYNLNQSDGHRCSLINLPDTEFDGNEFIFHSRIGESEGWVCYASVRYTGTEVTVSVWVLDEVNWKMLHKDIPIDDMIAEMHSRFGELSPIQVLGFSPEAVM